MLLKNKVAIVTGAAQGIGKAISELFSKEGAIVIICDIEEKKIKETAEEINKITSNIVAAFKVDVTKKYQIDKLVKDVVDKFEKIDILVNNAGIVILAPATEMKENEFDKVFEVNVKGSFLFTQAVAKVMIPNRYGKIINIASVSGKKPFLNEIAYAPSKSALIGLTRVFALELGKYNINCNAICPGPIITPLLEKHYLTNEKIEKEFIDATPLKRMAQTIDVANAALFFSTEQSKSITGESMLVTAGNTMNM